MTSHRNMKLNFVGLLVCLLALLSGACGVPSAPPAPTVQSLPDARPSVGGTAHWLGALNAPTVRPATRVRMDTNLSL